MPELPEVHALVRDLGVRLAGRTITRVQIASISALKTFDPPVSLIEGVPLGPVTRHGKFLDISVPSTSVGDLHILIHLARAGWIRFVPEVGEAPVRPGKSPLAARFVLDDGSGLDITEAGTKKSLAIHLVHAASEVRGVATLGPDPLDDAFTVESFAAILGGAGRAQIKGVLRSQSVIAGIGNAYSDEILHAARMSPFKPASMSPDEVAVLFEAMQVTLRDAIARSDGLAASELKKEKKSGMRVHGRSGQACPICGDTVRDVKFADSSLQYCPTCQTGGKPLADRVLSRLLK